MCGVYGAVGCEGINPEVVTALVDQLKSRGPDDRGIWVHPERSAALAHRRLRVTGTQGQQPLVSEDGNVLAVVNGEFYGYRRIRKSLCMAGHQFSTDCDSEVVVHLYEEYGMEFLSHLHGEFAFLLWDQRQRRMIAARDRFGIKPLVYYLTREGGVHFASSARALLPMIEDNRLDEESFFFATAMQYLPPSRSLFAGIRQLPAGHIAVTDGGRVHLQRYWQLEYPEAEQAERPIDETDRRDAAMRLRERIDQAVASRIDSDAKVCFHLSGGIDSSVVLASACCQGARDPVAYTIGCENADYDESAIARRTAGVCRADWVHVPVSSAEGLQLLDEAARMSEGLAINSHLAAKYLLNRRISEDGFKVALTGEGADEVFLSYAHLKLDWLGNRGGMGHGTVNRIYQSNRSSLGMMLPYGESLSTEAVQSRLGHVPMFLRAKATLGARIRSLLNEPLGQQWARRDAFGEGLAACNLSDASEGRSAVHQSNLLWCRLALAGYILKTLGDGTEMAWSVEGRLPFLDHRIVDFVRRLPIAMMFSGTTEKALLRQAARELLPAEVIKREKHPFDMPPLAGSHAALKRHVETLVESNAFVNQPFFCAQKVSDLCARIPLMRPVDRIAWDPVLTFVITTVANQRSVDSAHQMELCL